MRFQRTALGLSGAVLCFLAACVVIPERATRDARVLAIGDSILAWNRGVGRSIPDVVERKLSVPVVNAAVPGAGFEGRGFRSLPDQYVARRWDSVIVNGGANDLRSLCGCNQCDAVLDQLIADDGRSGEYPNLLEQITADRIVILGYYGPIRGGGGAFDGCDDELQTLSRRLARLAAREPAITFVPTRTLIAGDPAYYDDDRVHPSVTGSARIGSRVAEVMTK